MVENSDAIINDTLIENSQGNGISIRLGNNDPESRGTTITNTTVKGFTDGSGVIVVDTAAPVFITGGEITGNAKAITELDREGNSYKIAVDPSTIITDVNIHDNPSK